jgi:ATP-dependent DNA helicase PIF1
MSEIILSDEVTNVSLPESVPVPAPTHVPVPAPTHVPVPAPTHVPAPAQVSVQAQVNQMILSPEQQLALDEFSKGKNIFLTGPGGSGKTELIKRMVAASEAAHKKYQVCALTGCAAILLNCKAKTIHSWAGIGLANGTIEEVVRKVVGNKFKTAQWKKTDILIIDEVSMMSLKIFNILDLIAKKVRKNTSKPFGGIQIIFSGDFYQLPPVGNDEISSAFCFESEHWSNTFDSIIQLKTIFRQTDSTYSDILNQIRVGKLYKSALEKLNKHVNKPIPTTALFKPTILLPKRKDVDLINATELTKLGDVEQQKYSIAKVTELDLIAKPGNAKPGNTKPKQEYAPADISESQKEMEYNCLMNNIMADKEIILKKGSQVMCIANIDMESTNPIVNGSQGVVIEFVGGFPMVQFNNGDKRMIGYHNWISENIPTIGIKQIPLIHAWAITIHKAQGVSLDLAQIDVGSNIFECGQTYVALSRIKSMEGLYLTAFDPQKIKVNKKVQEFYTTTTF